MVSSIEKAVERLNKARVTEEVGEKEPTITTLAEDSAKSTLVAEGVGIGVDGKDESGGYAEEASYFSEVGADDDPLAASQSELVEKEPFTIDFEGKEHLGYLTPNSDNQVVWEEYRVIKRPLLINAFGKGAAPVERGNIILVTSSVPGEGKTFTSFNLAMSIATELDSTILMVDGDVLRSSLSKLVGAEDKPGLLDVLEDPDVELGDVILGTQIPKLKILPAGTRHKHSTELLASDSMDKLIAELGERYPDRIVLIDAPPMLATTEASVLTMKVGQIVMVVEAGRTPVEAVNESIERIDANKVLGLVLNKSRVKSGSQYYGGYYGSY
ncbi:XrtA-associated tyrosine autokinase [Candidatus Endoriftia persephone]|jgi:receptor protein-tyrosine kinase|uniref:non-specific protein-tyrosine kinase n=3 Tax=Gammaproteobacteria TaxID=1236 RepID=G2FHH6_9GAMM|nr:XrtA-associated tyrosine autokinase [Candidatus Endoriftia persephone]EGV51906.1 protein-tyrosine kinase [endosymbiont of Riftia pachyptila (vent Ph05)]EGW53736.1 protein-tyrosine kinase [endosymbiont of Tevnia jerichonana (vent Tica)]USF86435.1 XrtA-associated tyrosine autokinase [Candidatus Endoriftia persephone]